MRFTWTTFIAPPNAMRRCFSAATFGATYQATLHATRMRLPPATFVATFAQRENLALARGKACSVKKSILILIESLAVSAVATVHPASFALAWRPFGCGWFVRWIG